MFDNLRKLDDETEQLERSDMPVTPPVMKKRVLRFRSPIYNYMKSRRLSPDDDPLQERLEEYLQSEEFFTLSEPFVDPREETEIAYLTRIYVSDAEGKEYTVKIPEFLKQFNKELKEKHTSQN